MAIDVTAADVSPIMPPNNGMSSMTDMAVSPTSVASSGHFPFTASEIPSMGVDTSVLDTTFTSDVACSVGLDLPPDNGADNSRDPLRSFQIPWNISLSDLTADLSNLGGNSNVAFLVSFQINLCNIWTMLNCFIATSLSQQGTPCKLASLMYRLQQIACRLR